MRHVWIRNGPLLGYPRRQEVREFASWLLSSFRELWLRVRWVVLVVGILFAAAITRFMAMGMFASAT